VLYAFDLIEHDGDDSRKLPLIEWRAARDTPDHCSIAALDSQRRLAGSFSERCGDKRTRYKRVSN
jgi:hypothetical protein